MATVYILRNKQGRYYIGSTADLSRRLRHHQGGYTPSTRRLGVVELVLVQEYPTLKIARSIEKCLKRLKRADYIAKIVREGVIKMAP